MESIAATVDQLEREGKITPGRIIKKPMKLAEKLAEACRQVGGVEKRGDNVTQKYKYVKAADVAKAMRYELFDRGIVIIPSEVELRSERIQTNSGGYMTEVSLRTVYTVTDGSESLLFDAWGIARDSGDKAIYKAKTGALKYFLRGLGLIPDEKDDPEADESVDKESMTPNDYEAKFSEKTEGQRLVAQHQINAFNSAVKQMGLSDAQVAKNLAIIGGVTRIEDLTRENFQAAIKWALSPGVMQEAIEEQQQPSDLVLEPVSIPEGCTEVRGKIEKVSKEMMTVKNQPYHLVTVADLPPDINTFTVYDQKLFPAIGAHIGKELTLYFKETKKGVKTYRNIQAVEL